MTSDNDMPVISRNRANAAGRILRVGLHQADRSAREHAVMVARQWRAQHVGPTEQCFSRVLECSSHMPLSGRDLSTETYGFHREETSTSQYSFQAR